VSKCRRSRIFLDREVQGALMLRVGSYWAFCLMSICLLVICWSVYTGPPRRFSEVALEAYQRYAPALAASLILLPLVMIDVVRMSARFVGPVIRLRAGLRELADNGSARRLNFRDNDYWRDMADDFNAAATRLEEVTGRTPGDSGQLCFGDVVLH
jgi:methyl-accepting chemotaxis protein